MLNKRCCDRPNSYKETSMKYSSAEMTEYPEAMPQAMPTTGMGMGAGMMMPGCQMPPVYECPQERVVNREFVHEVPHIVPINTRVVNHHIYRHSYTPCYTCCEENVVCNVYDGCPRF